MADAPLPAQLAGRYGSFAQLIGIEPSYLPGAKARVGPCRLTGREQRKKAGITAPLPGNVSVGLRDHQEGSYALQVTTCRMLQLQPRRC